jgi:predicted TIM-barrel enzyme
MPQLFEILRRAGKGSNALTGVVAGSGQVTRCAVDAEADLLFVLNAGLYRTLGTGSLAAFLPYGNANDQTETLLREQVMPRAAGVPVVAGVLAGDPTVSLDERFNRLKQLGVSGVVNWPAVGFIDGTYRAILESEGLGIDAEAEMLRHARAHGFSTFAFALTPEEVETLAPAADAFVLDLGLTRSVGDIHTKDDELRQAIVRLNQMLRSAEKTAPGRPCLAFGGPIIDAEDIEQVFKHSAVHGFAGGSVFERIPVQDAVGATIRRFKSVAAGRVARTETISFGDMIGCGPAMGKVFDLIRRVAPHDVNVCIEGESGTGKELVATQLHRLSRRADQPFVTLNCGALPETLLESELFGHEKGSFTGAERRRPGKFELAHLYYRLSALTIQLPPLRQRIEDLPPLVESILAELRVRLNRPGLRLSAGFMEMLRNHPWPGNVRQCQHLLAQAALREDGVVLTGAFVESQPPQYFHRVQPLSSRRERAEHAIEEASGNKTRAAVMLGITRKTLYQWLGETQ